MNLGIQPWGEQAGMSTGNLCLCGKWERGGNTHIPAVYYCHVRSIPYGVRVHVLPTYYAHVEMSAKRAASPSLVWLAAVTTSHKSHTSHTIWELRECSGPIIRVGVG